MDYRLRASLEKRLEGGVGEGSARNTLAQPRSDWRELKLQVTMFEPWAENSGL